MPVEVYNEMTRKGLTADYLFQYSQHVSKALSLEVLSTPGLTTVEWAEARLVKFHFMVDVSMLVSDHANQSISARVSLFYDFLTQYRAAYITRVDAPPLSNTAGDHTVNPTMKSKTPAEGN